MSYFRRLSSSPLVRNIALVASGAAAGQAIAFAFAPLITRIYSPEVFGLQGVFLSLLSILSPVIALRYPMAIVVAQNEDDAHRLGRLSLLIALALSSLLILALAVAQPSISALLGVEALGKLIWFLPLALFCMALADVLAYRASRLQLFRLVAKVTAAQAFLTNLARVLGGAFSPVAATLVAVTSVAPSVHAFLLMLGTRKREYVSRPLHRSDAAALLKEHRDFPLFRMPTDVLNSASQSVPVILLAALFSPAVAGLYTLTRSVLNLPSNIIAAAIRNPLYARFAELARDGNALTPLLLRSSASLLALVPVIVGLAWFAPGVFAFVFGDEWREAGSYARWMSLWLAVGIANVPATNVLPVIGGQSLLLIFNVLLLTVRLLSILGVYWLSGSALMAVAWFSVISAIALVIANIIFTGYTIRYDRARKMAADNQR